jgi:hypothetical protein
MHARDSTGIWTAVSHTNSDLCTATCFPQWRKTTGIVQHAIYTGATEKYSSIYRFLAHSIKLPNGLSSCDSSWLARKALRLQFLLTYCCTQYALLFLRLVTFQYTIFIWRYLSILTTQPVLNWSLHCGTVNGYMRRIACDQFHATSCVSRTVTWGKKIAQLTALSVTSRRS